MTEAYAVFTTGTDYYDCPELFGIYASAEKAEAEAAVLSERLEDGELLYAEVSVTCVPIRY